MATWSTGAVPRAKQFTYWREAICEAFLDLTPESPARDGFLGRVAQRSLGRLDLARIDSQAQRVRRTERDIARSPAAGLYANLQVRGACRTAQDGRATVLRPGDLTVVDTTRPFTMEFAGDFRQLSLHIPERLLEAQLDQPLATATRVGTAGGVGAAIRHALQAIDGGALSTGSAARLAVHTCGLLAVALDHVEPAASQGGPALDRARRHGGLLDAALADLGEHLADDDLSPAATAARLGVSVRLLHQVFTGHERTFGGEVRLRRLDHAHRDLTDPARAALRVIDIAAEAGFADVTHFHRAFRRVYGYTPGEARRRTRV